MNAVAHIAALMSPETVRRLAALRVLRFDPAPPTGRRVYDVEEARARVLERWRGDLCGLLNAMSRAELGELAVALRLDVATTVRSPALRIAVWHRGAELERCGSTVPDGLQPRPILLGGHLVVQAAPRGLAPDSSSWPRPLPEVTLPMPPVDEPETLDELLAAADRAIGVRLGPRGLDKGAWGTRAARLLGIVERGLDEPDWRGDIEVKTVPVAREASGHWGVVEDPAIAMVGEERGGSPTIAKLQRTLWLARATCPTSGGPSDATIVSWYLLDWDPEVARLARRYLHTRPKGPAGTTGRGLYLHKRFFADAGLLASLNGYP